MTTSASVPSTNSHETVASRVLDMLDSWSKRLDGHQTQKRNSERNSFRRKLTLIIPEAESTDSEMDDKQVIEVWSRNISLSGTSFVTPEVIKADSVLVGIPSAEGKKLYFHADIIRHRQTHEQFWEYGLKFKERAHV